MFADRWKGKEHEIRFRFRFRDPISSGREIQMVRKNPKIGFWSFGWLVEVTSFYLLFSLFFSKLLTTLLSVRNVLASSLGYLDGVSTYKMIQIYTLCLVKIFDLPSTAGQSF